MVDITIPPAALEAGARVICLRDGFNPDDEIYTLVPASHPMQKLVRRWTLYVDAARAAFLAMLEAWPGMLTDGDIAPGENGPPLHLVNVIILPLTEKTDDKA